MRDFGMLMFLLNITISQSLRMEKFLHGNTIHASLKKVLISQNLASKRLTIYTKSCTLKMLHTVVEQ